MDITVVGAGRAGSSFESALSRAGHRVTLVHHDELDLVGDVDAVLLCVPDDRIDETARALAPGRYVVLHCAGSRGLSVLATHERVGSIHPLCALSDPIVGAERLVGATYCVSGDPVGYALVESLAGRAIEIGDEQRALYHATATVAANHLVALFGHVDVLARAAGLDLEDFVGLARQALDDVVRRGPEDALTGPASRGDVATIDAHLAALPDAERSTYVALADRAFALAERRRAGLRIL